MYKILMKNFTNIRRMGIIISNTSLYLLNEYSLTVPLQGISMNLHECRNFCNPHYQVESEQRQCYLPSCFQLSLNFPYFDLVIVAGDFSFRLSSFLFNFYVNVQTSWSKRQSDKVRVQRGPINK